MNPPTPDLRPTLSDSGSDRHRLGPPDSRRATADVARDTRLDLVPKYRVMKAPTTDSDAGSYQLAVKEDLVPLQP